MPALSEGAVARRFKPDAGEAGFDRVEEEEGAEGLTGDGAMMLLVAGFVGVDVGFAVKPVVVDADRPASSFLLPSRVNLPAAVVKALSFGPVVFTPPPNATFVGPLAVAFETGDAAAAVANTLLAALLGDEDGDRAGLCRAPDGGTGTTPTEAIGDTSAGGGEGESTLDE